MDIVRGGITSLVVCVLSLGCIDFGSIVLDWESGLSQGVSSLVGRVVCGWEYSLWLGAG